MDITLGGQFKYLVYATRKKKRKIQNDEKFHIIQKVMPKSKQIMKTIYNKGLKNLSEKRSEEEKHGLFLKHWT